MFLFRENHSDLAYRSLSGAVLIKLATGLMTIWGNSNIYYLSWLVQKGNPVRNDANSVILLASMVPISLLTLLATKASNKFGYELVVKICAGIFLLSPLMLNFVDSLVGLAFFLVVLPGSAFSISAIPLLNIVWGHFPAHRHKVTSILIFFFSLSGILWNYLFVMLVNPKNKQATVQQQQRLYFDESVTNNVLSTNNIISLITGICFVSGSLMVSQVQPRPEVSYSLIRQEPQKVTENELISSPPPSVLKLVFTLNFFLIFLGSLLNSLTTTYALTNFKIIFLPIINDDHYLTYILVVYSAASMAGTFYWGWYGDRHGITKTMLFIAIADSLVKLFLFLIAGKFWYGLYFLLIGVFDKGMVTVVGPGLVELFGVEGGTELLPFKAASVLITFAIIPIVQIATKDYCTPYELLKGLVLFNMTTIIPCFFLWLVNRKR